jgi:hypothetical protein
MKASMQQPSPTVPVSSTDKFMLVANTLDPTHTLVRFDTTATKEMAKGFVIDEVVKLARMISHTVSSETFANISNNFYSDSMEPTCSSSQATPRSIFAVANNDARDVLSNTTSITRSNSKTRSIFYTSILFIVLHLGLHILKTRYMHCKLQCNSISK